MKSLIFVTFSCNWEKFSAGYITPAQRIAPLLILLLVILGWHSIWKPGVFLEVFHLSFSKLKCVRITCCCCCCFGSSQKKGAVHYRWAASSSLLIYAFIQMSKGTKSQQRNKKYQSGEPSMVTSVEWGMYKMFNDNKTVKNQHFSISGNFWH